MTINDLLIRHEGLRLKPYKDIVGKMTIGVGRNLDDVGVSKGEALYLLNNDIERVSGDLDSKMPWWRSMSVARQFVFQDMCFNLGLQGFLGFTTFLELCRIGHYDAAAVAGLDSRWAQQVGVRATQMMTLLKTGSWE